MSVGTTAAIVAAGIGAAGAIGSSVISSHAAGKAADQQVNAENQALDFQKSVYGTQTANEQPYVDAGQQSIGQLMSQLKDGTFGAGSNPAFAAPTAEQARQTPGYQFSFDQGMRGVNSSAAAKGGALSGAAIKEAAQFGTGLADSTYNDTFNRSLQAYQINLQKQAQEFGQESGTAALGQSGIQSIGNTGTQAATNIGNIMGNIGNAQAAGTVGSANAWSSGIGGAANSISQGILLGKFNYPNSGYPGGTPPFIGNGGQPIMPHDGEFGAFGEIPA